MLPPVETPVADGSCGVPLDTPVRKNVRLAQRIPSGMVGNPATRDDPLRDGVIQPRSAPRRAKAINIYLYCIYIIYGLRARRSSTQVDPPVVERGERRSVLVVLWMWSR